MTICLWCQHEIKYTQDKTKYQVEMMEHLLECKDHPLMKRIDTLKTKCDKLVEALANIQEQMECPAIQCEGKWQTGMFCGLEDRGITDRYDACLYGYNHAIERIEEWALSGIDESLKEAGEL